jgi:hypothetical protein
MLSTMIINPTGSLSIGDCRDRLQHARYLSEAPSLEKVNFSKYASQNLEKMMWNFQLS